MKIELLIVFLIVHISLMGQQTTVSDKTKSDRRIQKEFKKEQKKLIQQNEEFKAIVQALSDSSFVFEAKTISSGRGRTNRLDGTTGFFAIFGNQATLRVSADA